MMKSTFLASSQVSSENPTEEFVIVQQPSSFDMLDDIGDDESYDYCDDVYSMVTGSDNVKSTCSDMIPEIELCEADDSMGHGDQHQEVIFSVPSNLMKNLDDAHKAAKLAVASGSEHRSDLSCHSHDIASLPNNDSLGKEARNDESPSVAAERPLDAKPTSISLDNITTSRTSNKKRRKKLKLMKKAMAAAHAAQALSDKATRSSSLTTAKSSPKKAPKNKTPTGRSGKRVANIAVVCARESLAAYRRDLAKNSARPHAAKT